MTESASPDRPDGAVGPGGPAGWSVAAAEELLGSLAGVVSARVVTGAGGEVREVHVLTTAEVTPKQTVRNVESALLAHFDLEVDHRRISVAQSREAEPAEGPRETSVRLLPARGDARILFVGHQVETRRSHQVRFRVEVEWRGERFEGESSGADLVRARLETAAAATLRAVEAAVRGGPDDGRAARDLALSLDGVKIVDAFDRSYVLVAVHAFVGRHVTSLDGSSVVEESADKAVILATLQATDRWVRGRA